MTQQQPTIIVQRTSSASSVFWGLFLFFIVLPIGSCVACGSCLALTPTTTTTTTHNSKELEQTKTSNTSIDRRQLNVNKHNERM